MKLSIIIPVYNVECYLHQCIDSVLGSTFTNYELILVDDGSTDASGRICDEYAVKDKRIRVFHQENGGVSKARNVGIDNANAPWITFIDADDWISGTFLENLYKAVEEHPDIDFVQAGCTNYRNGAIADVEQHYVYYHGDNKEKLFSEFRGLAVSKLYKRTILNGKNKVRYDEKLPSLEDFLFTLDYIQYVNHYVFLSEEGYLYRRDNEKSITNVQGKYTYSWALQLYKHMSRSIEAYISQNAIKRVPRHRREAVAKYMWLAINVLYRMGITKEERLQRLHHDFPQEEKRNLLYVEGKKNRILGRLFIYDASSILFDYMMCRIHHKA